MNRITPLKTSINCCRYCGIVFSDDVLRNIDEHNSIICETCGAENNKSDIKLNELESIDQKLKNESRLHSYLRYLYESLRNGKGPIVKVFEDSDFPKIFKENFIIVVCRLIYYNFKISEQNLIHYPNNAEFTKDLSDEIYKGISPILSMRVKIEFLDNLFKISIKEFEKFLRILQKKIKINKKFRQNFILYLRWLIKEFHIIIADLWDQKDLPKFERIIRYDLKSYNFCFNHSIKNIGCKQILIDDKQNKVKKCGRCHQIFPYDRFYPVSKGSEKVRAYCKQCHSDLSLISQNSKSFSNTFSV